MARAFDCNIFPMELDGPNINKLGNIDYETFWNQGRNHNLTVVNAYTQYYPRIDLKPFDYEAFTIICRKMNHIFKGKHIGLPMIGAGLAGGDWYRISEIIQKELSNCDVTVVIYNQNKK